MRDDTLKGSDDDMLVTTHPGKINVRVLELRKSVSFLEKIACLLCGGHNDAPAASGNG